MMNTFLPPGVLAWVTVNFLTGKKLMFFYFKNDPESLVEQYLMEQSPCMY